MDVLKVQTTVRGYYAWVIQRMMVRNSEPLADTVNYLLRLWIDKNASTLEELGLSRERFENELATRDKVTDFSRKETG